jgi:hypothetical protein
MRRWAWMLGGLIVWAIHFAGVYALASLAAVVSAADDRAWRMTGLAFSGVCILAALALAVLAARRLDTSADPVIRFWNLLACLGAGLAAVAILWQALPALIGY